MKTFDQLFDLPSGHRARGIKVEGLTCDSRLVRPGHVFVALPGVHADGHAYLAEAAGRQAAVLVGERPPGAPCATPFVQVRSSRAALADLACRFYDHPSARLTVFGVTGTNGKTSTTFLLRDVLRSTGRKPGLIGTVQYEIGARLIPAQRTTPEAHELQALLDGMVRAGCDSVVMEVSSHGITQMRVRGVAFDVGVFTGLTRDHLDFHGDMDRYFASKAAFMESIGAETGQGAAVVHADDPYAQRLVEDGRMRAPVLTYGRRAGADVRAVDVHLRLDGATFRAVTPWGEQAVRTRLAGAFNVDNALAALAAAVAAGCPFPAACEALAGAAAAPGRMEPIGNDLGALIVVDYAHTDDALDKALEAMREVVRKRLIVVFGCGGDRDRGKRPRMAEAAARRADEIVVTSDNPRTEDPEQILRDIEAGFPPDRACVRIPDRREAIAYALERAGEGDGVLIAGKGHEGYQEIGHSMHPFDDRQVVRALLAGRACPRGRGASSA